MTLDPLRNPLDPLHKTGPEAGKVLYQNLAQVCIGFPNDAVLNAALNLVMTVVRKNHPTWQSAEGYWDEWFAKAKTNMRDHYDANGRQRNIYPFDQNILMPLFQNKNKFKT